MIRQNEEGYFDLYLDTDDVLIDSSTILQGQVDSKTPFKTMTLKMLEQLNRNCKYYKSVVEEECEKAYEERRLPNLKRFPNFSDYNFFHQSFDFSSLNETQIDYIYKNPVRFAEYYVSFASDLLNLFLEERDIFLEKDNLPKGETKNYNYEEEQKVLNYYEEALNNNRQALSKINYFCVREIKRIVNIAKSDNEIPNYGELIRMDNNDIIRTNRLNRNLNRNIMLYEEPIEIVSRCIIYEENLDDVIKNFPLMMEPSEELIDYDSIYIMRNVNWKAIQAIRELIDSGLIRNVYNISHHNGERESLAKQRFIYALFPQTTFIGMRFHEEEHNMNRRTRSSKMKEAIKRQRMSGRDAVVDPCRKILIDDSKENDRDWENRGGKAILCRKETDSEFVRGHLENTGFVRITDFDGDELIEIVKSYEISLLKRKRMGENNGR